MGFSQKAKVLYDKANLTQKELAELTGISESMVSRYLSGTTVPKEDVAEKIIDVLTKASAAEEVKQPDDHPRPRVPMVQDEAVSNALLMLQKNYDGRIADLRETYESRITDLKNDLAVEKREKWIFVSLLGLVIAFVFVLLFIDVTNGNFGWFRY